MISRARFGKNYVPDPQSVGGPIIKKNPQTGRVEGTRNEIIIESGVLGARWGSPTKVPSAKDSCRW